MSRLVRLSSSWTSRRAPAPVRHSWFTCVCVCVCFVSLSMSLQILSGNFYFLLCLRKTWLSLSQFSSCRGWLETMKSLPRFFVLLVEVRSLGRRCTNPSAAGALAKLLTIANGKMTKQSTWGWNPAGFRNPTFLIALRSAQGFFCLHRPMCPETQECKKYTIRPLSAVKVLACRCASMSSLTNLH